MGTRQGHREVPRGEPGDAVPVPEYRAGCLTALLAPVSAAHRTRHVTTLRLKGRIMADRAAGRAVVPTGMAQWDGRGPGDDGTHEAGKELASAVESSNQKRGIPSVRWATTTSDCSTGSRCRRRSVLPRPRPPRRRCWSGGLAAVGVLGGGALDDRQHIEQAGGHLTQCRQVRLHLLAH